MLHKTIETLRNSLGFLLTNCQAGGHHRLACCLRDRALYTSLFLPGTDLAGNSGSIHLIGNVFVLRHGRPSRLIGTFGMASINSGALQQCTVCYDELSQDLTAAPCGHVFHSIWSVPYILHVYVLLTL